VNPRFLSIEKVLWLHAQQLRQFGGATGVRDLGLLQSAMGNAAATFGGVFLNETVFEMAAAYLYGICKNHPFVDGNKRTAVASALVFLETNGVWIEADEDEFYDLVIDVAEGSVDKAGIATFFEAHSIGNPS
jgi:death-on-curing protein